MNARDSQTYYIVHPPSARLISYISRPLGSINPSDFDTKFFFLQIMSSIHAELDSPNAKVMNASRIMRVARGSGRTLQDVHDLLDMYKQTCKAMKPMSKMLQKNADLTHINKLLPPSMLSQLGGRNALQSMANKFKSPQK